MNKLKLTIAGLFVACLGIGVVSAQATTGTKQTHAKKSTASKSKTGSTTTPAKHLKKDGTPDMRYKENKAAAKKTGTKKAAPKKAATGNKTM